MRALTQHKAVAPDDIRTWQVDLEAMAACAPWSAGEPERCGEELAGILEGFPTFIATLGRRLTEDESWVEAGEPHLCPQCAELVIFDDGVRCVACRQPVEPPEDPMVGVVGRIPALISSRPFWHDLQRRLAGGAGSAAPDGFEESVLRAGERIYLAPRYGLWFSSHWPHSDPPVMVWPEYFPVLGIPPDHVYTAGRYYRLCLYADWREQPCGNVLQHRVAPRLHIDLMVADLQAVGALDEALDRLDCNLYELYNMVGRPAKAAPLRRVYEELVNG